MWKWLFYISPAAEWLRLFILTRMMLIQPYSKLSIEWDGKMISTIIYYDHHSSIHSKLIHLWHYEWKQSGQRIYMKIISEWKTRQRQRAFQNAKKTPLQLNISAKSFIIENFPTPILKWKIANECVRERVSERVEKIVEKPFSPTTLLLNEILFSLYCFTHPSTLPPLR